MVHTINYTASTNEHGDLTYIKKDFQGNQVFESLEDIFCDPDFDRLVADLECIK